MLTEIHLQNFKCFGPETGVLMSRMNLFTGINGRGKSTLLQTLLCMRQSPEHSRTTERLYFNGSCVALGTFRDVKNREISSSSPIVLGFDFEQDDNYATLFYSYKELEGDNMVAVLDHIKVSGELDGEEFAFSILNRDMAAYIEELDIRVPFNDLFIEAHSMDDRSLEFVANLVGFQRIHYVSADRIGPLNHYERKSHGSFPHVGSRGEYTADILQRLQNNAVLEGMRHEQGADSTLLAQTSAWFSEIFSGGNLSIHLADPSNVLTLAMNADGNKVHLHKPVNLGYGFSHVLPIIVSALIAQPGEILIVENPEAHLHPAAQSRITAFLAKLSSCGVQVFIESHSDHVLNSLRVSVKRKLLAPDDVNILFFQDDDNVPVMRIPILEDGRIEEWPKAFFDQSSIDLGIIHGI